jgi:superoxide reductase
MAVKFFRCNHCGNVVMKLKGAKAPMMCCGEKMMELIPNSTNANILKHMPVVYRLDSCKIKVEVGSVPHPMLSEHHVEFIYVECEKGGIMVEVSNKSEAIVCTCQDDPVAVYEYCNLHGLWRAEL